MSMFCRSAVRQGMLESPLVHWMIAQLSMSWELVLIDFVRMQAIRIVTMEASSKFTRTPRFKSIIGQASLIPYQAWGAPNDPN